MNTERCTKNFAEHVSNFVERIEYLKPIMFTGGIGAIKDNYSKEKKFAIDKFLNFVGQRDG